MEFNNIWNKEEYEKLINYLKSNNDLKYLEFTKRIIDTKYHMIGVKSNILREISKTISKTDLESFFKYKEDKYYEEVLLEAYVIGKVKDNNKFEQLFNNYLDKIDCWSLCDQAASSFKIISKNKEYWFKIINELIKSKKEYYVRMGIILLLDYYIDKDYLENIFNITDSIKREEYYINMAIAWLLSICYIKYKDETEKYLKKSNLSDFVFRKTISKICDSYRVDKSDKERLKKIVTKKTS